MPLEAVYQSLLARVQEMRANLETFASDAEKAGVSGLSFDEWRNVLDRQEAVLRSKLHGAK